MRLLNVVPENPQPENVHQGNADRMQEMLGQLAPALGTFRESLIDEGFTREEALELVARFMRDLQR